MRWTTNRIVRIAVLVAAPVAGSLVAHTALELRALIWVGVAAVWVLLHAAERAGRAADVAEATAASQARFAAFVQHSSDVVTVVDDKSVIRYQSPSVKRVFGYEPDALIGTDLRALLHPDDRRRVFGTILDAIAEGRESVMLECRVQHANGSWRHAEAAVSSLLDDPEVKGIILNTRDISERRALQEALAHQAFHDPLTKLANRALLLDRTAHALRRAERRQRALAVLMLDLDGFKMVNDTLGHNAGDELLVMVAERVASCIRPTDTAARLGGDEFAVLLEDLADPDDWQVVAERILETLRSPFVLGGKEAFVHGSIGIALADDPSIQADDLVRNADVAMYTAKARGKNCHRLFKASMHEDMLKRLDIERDLRRAIERQEFILHYQPTVVLQTGRIAGVEALVRWQHPEKGLIPPLDFIPVAEETGMIVQLGEWVLREACHQAARWHVEHPSAPPLKMNVNLSARQLQHDGFLDTVRAVLAETGIDPSSLVLEITESAVVKDAASTLIRLKALKALGIRLAIDDFGTGYSSLSYLRRFPVDVLKIDRSFVDGVTEGTQKQALLRTIVELGRTLKLETVAEGIELHEELHQLRSLDCELGQGYLFARPLTAESVNTLLSKGQVATIVPPLVPPAQAFEAAGGLADTSAVVPLAGPPR